MSLGRVLQELDRGHHVGERESKSCQEERYIAGGLKNEDICEKCVIYIEQDGH